MGRRDESVLDVPAMCPWWVSVLLAATAFLGLRFVGPLLAPSGPATAPFVAFILLVSAPIAAFRQWRQRRLLDRQDGLASIRRLSWARFETLSAEAHRRQGYTVAHPAGNGPEGGVDLILRKEGRMLLVQCKHWKAWKVGVKVGRESRDQRSGVRRAPRSAVRKLANSSGREGNRPWASTSGRASRSGHCA